MAARHAPIQLKLETPRDERLMLHPHVSPSSLTPPVTPTNKAEDDQNSSHAMTAQPVTPCGSAADLHRSRPLEFIYDLELRRSDDGQPLEFGRGVWSVVYMATSRWSSPASGLTPPSSPAVSSRVLAVKSPLRRDAHSVLEAEARILTRIRAASDKDRYVVPFHGYIPTSHSIVMSAVPLALSTYIRDRAALAQKNFSTRTMFDPVLGMAQWHDLALQLISGLSWLHSKPGVVHGDIKPHNILLRPRKDRVDDSDRDRDIFPYEPLYTDFSSAHDMSSPKSALSGAATPLSALTPPFAAPELLSVAALKSSDVLVTQASDVFSLAVTLLAAATGDLVLYPGTSSMQRLAMSREGHRVLDFVRSGAHGSRVPRNGLVEKSLKPAVVKDPSERISPGEWLQAMCS
ncbi:hypothetical protein VTN77DRAFT_2087 [Rasamsonia byssochlamydoides]|uniref:uncharacterized protein n=1 Tax=Rasamsonia byssochlamydoides TaxID=89139 RepID=UPI0037433942